MSVKQLVTTTFPKNVGGAGNVLRVPSRRALTVLPWMNLIPSPGPAAMAITIFGLIWAMTGIRNRCSIYDLLRVSTQRDGR